MSEAFLRQRYPGYPAFDERPKGVRAARQELAALLAIEEGRVRNLVHVLGIDYGSDDVGGDSRCNAYLRASAQACELFPMPRYSFEGYGPRKVDQGHGRVAITDTGPELTLKGEYLAGDLALMFARCLMERDSGLSWGVLTRPRSEVSYLLPVVTRPDQRFHCDPFLVIGTIATGIVIGTRGCDAWSAALDAWTDILAGSPGQAERRSQLQALTDRQV